MSDPRDPAKVIPKLPRAAKGPRPFFFEDEAADILLSMNVALLTELLVTRERLDTVERLLEAGGSLDRDAVEHFQGSDEVEAEREARNEAIANRVFYLLLHQAERIARGDSGADGIDET